MVDASGSGGGSTHSVIGDIEKESPYWPEYQYRHTHIWNNIYKLTFAVAFLSVVPYLYPKVVFVITWWAIWPPLLAFALALFGTFRAHRELIALGEIKDRHREFLRLNLPGNSNFKRDVMVYLVTLLLAAAVNTYVVLVAWIPNVQMPACA
ncbi:hypothetical protein [Halioxenophilus sp. WMMB6]|uniref:hypothetical protein n=1 Tax=Halioxenophilus sp. WMMB6 TaxID=3073815 RepID=UPI00295F0EFE|nr:hypothetical protein [Halioxenophilus sp. WMMB6]